MKVLILLLLTITLSACSHTDTASNNNSQKNSHGNSHDYSYFKASPIVLSHNELAQLQQLEMVSEAELQAILSKHSLANSDLGTTSIDDLTADYADNRLECMGVYIEDPLHGKVVNHYKILGVTEKWVPIEGKVTKVLHLKMVP